MQGRAPSAQATHFSKCRIALLTVVVAALMVPVSRAAAAADLPALVTTDLESDALLSGLAAFGGAADAAGGVAEVKVGIRNRDTGKWLRSNGSFKRGIRRLEATTTPGEGNSVVWSVSFDIPTGDYAASIVAIDTAGNVTPIKPWVQFSVERPKLLVAAGDVAQCGLEGAHQTADLLDRIFANRSGTLAMLGDGAYVDGTPDEYTNCYHPTWGRHKNRTRPTPGNHDYDTDGAAGYFGYFGPRARNPEKGYYAYNRGDWRVIVLNTECAQIGGCSESSAIYQWLENQLQNNPRQCILAYGHKPRFESGPHGDRTSLDDLWELLYEAGADVVLAGHSHNYQRFGKIDSEAQPASDGIRPFIVGTGGGRLGDIVDPHPRLRGSAEGEHGVLALELFEGRYTWKFINVDDVVLDSGEAVCTG